MLWDIKYLFEYKIRKEYAYTSTERHKMFANSKHKAMYVRHNVTHETCI